MPRFSQRIGVQPVRVEIQRESMDSALQNKIWSALHLCIFDFSEIDLHNQGIDAHGFALRMWVHFYNEPADTTPKWDRGRFASEMRQRFFGMQWYEAYDFIEACIENLPEKNRPSLCKLLNAFLESEMSAYRIVDGRVAEIVSETDISAIEGAVAATSRLIGAQTHLRRALQLLTDRAAPDPRNSIKESILAVEAVCKAIAGDSSATLGQAIKRLADSGVVLHPALVKAWSNLYGYTNDADGIRHALTDEPKVGFADGKYMLVTCSAFISYLFSLAAAVNLEIAPPE